MNDQFCEVAASTEKTTECGPVFLSWTSTTSKDPSLTLPLFFKTFKRNAIDQNDVFYRFKRETR
jgi:hypothetical protein